MNPAEPNYFGRDTQKDYFFYSVQVPSIDSTTGPVSTPLNIDNDADFYWIASTYQAWITPAAPAALTEATNVIPLVYVELQDTGSGRYFQARPIPLPAIAGDGKRPYRLIRPRRFGANTTINMKWTNIVTAGTTYRIEFVLHGYKIYRQAPVPV